MLTVNALLSRRKIDKGPRTIMLQIYIGSARDLSAKNNQNTKTARLILRKKCMGDKRVQGTEPDIAYGSILQLNCASISLLALF